MAVVDLHLHTTFSDGRLSPTELVNLAASNGLQIIAVTDHDSTEGLSEAFQAASAFPHLTVIPGIELSTDVPGNEIHLLGYFLRYSNHQFQETISRFRDGRVDRARGMVEKLAGLGVHIEWDRVLELAGHGAIGRPHLALAMVEKGYVSQPREAFDKYIGRNGPAYVEREKLTPADAIALIRGVEGVPVLAHPAELNDLNQTLEELRSAGLVGMEVFYAQYSPDKIQELVKVAARHELLPCGGSDYHALGNDNEPLPGQMGPPLEVVEKLRALAEVNPRN